MANIYNDSNFASESTLPGDATFTSVTTNSLIIPAAQNGDLLFANANHEVNGLAIAPKGLYLISNGTTPTYAPRQLYVNNGTSFGTSSVVIFSTASLSVENGYRYRIMITGILTTAVATTLNLGVAGTPVRTYNYSSSTGVCIDYFHNATFSGPLLVTLNGTSASVAPLQNINLTIEIF